MLIYMYIYFTIYPHLHQSVTLSLQALDSLVGNLSDGQLTGVDTPGTALHDLDLVLVPLPHVLLHDAHELQPPHWQLNPLRSGQAPCIVK